MSTDRPDQWPERAGEKLDRPEPSESAKGYEIPGTNGRVVLLVDYEDLLVGSLRQLLEADGFTVLSGQSPQDALRVCEQYAGNIDALVVGVPGDPAPGFDLAASVASKHPEISIVFTWPPPLAMEISSCETCKRALEHFLPKPFVYAQLRRKIVQLLAEAPQPPLDWLLHSYKKPEQKNPAPETKREKIETKHRVTVQLDIVEKENLFVTGSMLQPNGTERPCLIELRVETLLSSRPLRLSDLKNIGQTPIRLIIHPSPEEQLPADSTRTQLKKRARKQP